MSAISAIGGSAAPASPHAVSPAAHAPHGGHKHGGQNDDVLIISQDGMDALAASSGTVDLVDHKHHKHHHDLALLVYTDPRMGHGHAQSSGAVAAVGTAGSAAPSGGGATK